MTKGVVKELTDNILKKQLSEANKQLKELKIKNNILVKRNEKLEKFYIGVKEYVEKIKKD